MIGDGHLWFFQQRHGFTALESFLVRTNWVQVWMINVMFFVVVGSLLCTNFW